MGLRHPALILTSYLFPRPRGKIEMGGPLYSEEPVRPEPVEGPLP